MIVVLLSALVIWYYHNTALEFKIKLLRQPLVNMYHEVELGEIIIYFFTI